MNRLGTRLEDITYNRIKEVAKEKNISVSKDGKPRSKADIIEEMRDRYVRPAMLNTSYSSDDLEDIQLALKTGNTTTLQQLVKSVPKSVPKKHFYKTEGNLRTDLGEECPYDLEEISRAADVEPYISISIRKHREQILKDGYGIKTRDVDIKRYLEKRLFELSLRSPNTFDEVVRETFTNLIKYHTAFIVIERDMFRSSGRKIKMFGKELDPISSIYCIDPTTMRPVLSKKANKVLRWNHVSSLHCYDSDRKVSSWPAHDVIVITMDRKSGYLFGTPYIMPVLDDIRALRRLEELVQIVSSKHAFPLFHWVVGTQERPAKIYDDGSSELDLVLGEAETVGDSGAIVTNERSEIRVIGAEGVALDLSKYLEYFENRSLGGLRLSQMDLGRGNSANKASAHTMSKSIEDASADYQRVFSQTISWRLFLYLALEGGFDVTEQNMPYLDFPPINSEEQRAKETHGTLLFQSNGITSEEYRREFLGKEPLSGSEDGDTHFRRYDMPKVEETEKIKAQVGNKAMPANQSGQKATKTRVTANNSYEPVSSYLHQLDGYKKGLLNLFEKKDVVWEEVGKVIEKEVKDSISKFVISHFHRGISDCSKQLEKEKPYVSNKYIHQVLNIFTTNLLHSNINSFKLRINDNLHNDRFYVSSLVDLLIDSLKEVYSLSMATAYRTGFIKTARIFNSATIKFETQDSTFVQKFDQRTLPIKLLAASKDNLGCSLSIEKENED